MYIVLLILTTCGAMLKFNHTRRRMFVTLVFVIRRVCLIRDFDNKRLEIDIIAVKVQLVLTFKKVSEIISYLRRQKGLVK